MQILYISDSTKYFVCGEVGIPEAKDLLSVKNGVETNRPWHKCLVNAIYVIQYTVNKLRSAKPTHIFQSDIID